MDEFLSLVAKIIAPVNSFAWGPVMLALLVGTGIYLTIRMNWIQVTKFPYIFRHTLGGVFTGRGRDHGANISPFQAVSAALAGTVGTGNIAGVTGALFTGGPGALFWMWVSAFFGMCTKYSEIALAIKFREQDADGAYHGGPMYYIKNGLGKKWMWLAVIFCVFGGLASFGIGNIAQSTEMTSALRELFGLGDWTAGCCIAFAAATVIIGGIKRVGRVASFLVPFMALFYIVCGIAVIVMRYDAIPGAFSRIIDSAFSLRSAGGGIFGYAIMQAMRAGFARGVFSNEAGLGSAPIVHAASSTKEPAAQAIWGVFEVFFDTGVICTITGLAVILSGVLDAPGGVSAFGSNSAAAVSAFNIIFDLDGAQTGGGGTLGGKIIFISIVFFSFTTLISWSYYGETCWAFLTRNNKKIIFVYKILFIATCFVGAKGSGKLMWDIADTFNGLMAIPNLIALIPLAGVVAKITKDYFAKEQNHAAPER